MYIIIRLVIRHYIYYIRMRHKCNYGRARRTSNVFQSLPLLNCTLKLFIILDNLYIVIVTGWRIFPFIPKDVYFTILYDIFDACSLTVG